jgi:hypothetical protein
MANQAARHDTGTRMHRHDTSRHDTMRHGSLAVPDSATMPPSRPRHGTMSCQACRAARHGSPTCPCWPAVAFGTRGRRATASRLSHRRTAKHAAPLHCCSQAPAPCCRRRSRARVAAVALCSSASRCHRRSCALRSKRAGEGASDCQPPATSQVSERRRGPKSFLRLGLDRRTGASASQRNGGRDGRE